MTATHQVTQHRSAVRGVEAMALLIDRGFPRHTHDQFGIGLMNRGGHRSWSGIGPVEAAAGDFIYLGRRLYPLLREAGFDRVSVSPRVIYVDGGRPDLMDGFILKTFTAMIAGIRESAVAEGLASAQQFNAGAAAHRGGGRQLLLHVFKRRGLKGE